MSAAFGGYPVAQTEVGYYYFEDTPNRDFEKAQYWFRRAADQEQHNSEFMLGFMYLNGLGVDEDAEKAHELLGRAARAGLAEAQYYYGQNFHYGTGAKQDFSEAMTWLQKAADQEYARAYKVIAHLYEKGEGVSKSAERQRKYLQAAADLGDLDSLTLLGLSYPITDQRRIQSLEKAANAGYPKAMYHLGRFWRLKCPRQSSDREYGYQWLKKAADAGFEKAQDAMASMPDNKCTGSLWNASDL